MLSGPAVPRRLNRIWVLNPRVIANLNWTNFVLFLNRISVAWLTLKKWWCFFSCNPHLFSDLLLATGWCLPFQSALLCTSKLGTSNPEAANFKVFITTAGRAVFVLNADWQCIDPAHKHWPTYFCLEGLVFEGGLNKLWDCLEKSGVWDGTRCEENKKKQNQYTTCFNTYCWEVLQGSDGVSRASGLFTQFEEGDKLWLITAYFTTFALWDKTHLIFKQVLVMVGVVFNFESLLQNLWCNFYVRLWSFQKESKRKKWQKCGL